MMREWATVVAWNNGVATLRCNRNAGCDGCKVSASCGINILNNASAGKIIEFKLSVNQPLSVGQKVEVGVREANLLYSALLIYLIPLAGLFAGAALCHWLVDSTAVSIIGALLGGIAGFFTAKRYVVRLEKKHFYQPVILQISPAVETY